LSLYLLFQNLSIGCQLNTLSLSGDEFGAISSSFVGPLVDLVDMVDLSKMVFGHIAVPLEVQYQQSFKII